MCVSGGKKTHLLATCTAATYTYARADTQGHTDKGQFAKHSLAKYMFVFGVHELAASSIHI
jgi:hypothetical protein